MDKNSIIGITLITLLITGWMIYNSLQQDAAPPAGTEEPPQTEEILQTENTVTQSAGFTVEQTSAEEETDDLTPCNACQNPSSLPNINIETELYQAIIDTNGAELVSLKLKKHVDGDRPLEMIYRGDSPRAAFELYLGDYGGNYQGDENQRRVRGDYAYRKLNPLEHEFSINVTADGRPLTIKKTYVFAQAEYMIELRISIIDRRGVALDINRNGFLYTLNFGPQIGPTFTKLGVASSRAPTDYRQFAIYNGKKVQALTTEGNFLSRAVMPDDEYSTDEKLFWSSLKGKYFLVVGIPPGSVTSRFFSKSISGLNDAAQMSYLRQGRDVRTAEIHDSYRYYIGPKLKENFAPFDRAADNSFGLQDMRLSLSIDSSILDPLQTLFKWLLSQIYRVTNNYGVAILILAILIKVMLFPLTHKSYQSTSRMQEIQPQLKELQAKYKDDPTKLNREMANLYKTEGINPAGGCLPLLLQLPIILALFGIFYRYFDFRGAAFIPGWIDDLSQPESVYELTNPINFLFINISAIRILPVIYLVSQFLMSKFMQMQNASAASGSFNTKLMMYGMPVFFFFICYDFPSGVIVYWTFSNVLTTLQQRITNEMKKKGMFKINPKKRKKVNAGSGKSLSERYRQAYKEAQRSRSAPGKQRKNQKRRR